MGICALIANLNFKADNMYCIIIIFFFYHFKIILLCYFLSFDWHVFFVTSSNNDSLGLSFANTILNPVLWSSIIYRWMIFNLSDKAADFYICSRFVCALMHAFPPLSPCYFYFNIFCTHRPLKVIIASSSRPRKEYNRSIIQQLPLSSDIILVAGGTFWWLWVRSWWDGQVRF